MVEISPIQALRPEEIVGLITDEGKRAEVPETQNISQKQNAQRKEA
jgi:hypothetical protein